MPGRKETGKNTVLQHNLPFVPVTIDVADLGMRAAISEETVAMIRCS